MDTNILAHGMCLMQRCTKSGTIFRKFESTFLTFASLIIVINCVFQCSSLFLEFAMLQESSFMILCYSWKLAGREIFCVLKILDECAII